MGLEYLAAAFIINVWVNLDKYSSPMEHIIGVKKTNPGHVPIC